MNWTLNYSKIVLVILYVVGILGILTSYRAFILPLTPFNLLITFVILVYHQPNKKNKLFQAFLLFVFVTGLAIEIIGVNTGWPFGRYEYYDILGWKVLNTPLIIGINWALLVLATASCVNTLPIIFPFTKAIIGAFIMILLDIWMEPVAINLGFWGWMENNGIPFSNYISWWAISFVFFLIFFYAKINKENDIAPWVLATQFLFFGILGSLA